MTKAADQIQRRPEKLDKGKSNEKKVEDSQAVVQAGEAIKGDL